MVGRTGDASPVSPAVVTPLLSVIILIDDLAAGHILHKYVDNITISEPLSSTSQTTDVQSYINRLLL